MNENNIIMTSKPKNNLETSNDMDFASIDSITHGKPFDVYYQTVYSNKYDVTGFEFQFTTPGYNALLSKEVWLEYSFELHDGQAHQLSQMFENYQNNYRPLTDSKLAFRSGNVLARVIDNMVVRFNNYEMLYQPQYYIDVWNRLHVSNDESEHEFSASGGRFDEGNHGVRTLNQMYAEYIPHASGLPAGFAPVIPIAPAVPNAATSHTYVFLYSGWHTNATNIDFTGMDATRDFICHMRPNWPEKYEYYNPGFESRHNKFSYGIRADWVPIANVLPRALPGFQFNGGQSPYDPTFNRWVITFTERLPIPLFKMYSKDGNDGLIAHVRNMNIRASFVSNIIQMMFREDADLMQYTLDFASQAQTDCKLHLKWYIPSFPIPPQISMTCPKIITYHEPFNLVYTAQETAAADLMFTISGFEVGPFSFPAVPDLLIFFSKTDFLEYSVTTPDDNHYEIFDIYMDMNQSSGKLLNMQSIQFYESWKKNLKHNDPKIIGYDEWRKNCFVAVLKPEHYGIKNISEYNQGISIKVNGSLRNWQVVPSVNYALYDVNTGVDQNASQFIMHAVYFRNILHMNIDRCHEELKPM